jgi:hypothetical protein
MTLNQLVNFAADFGWALKAPEVAISVMKDFVFNTSPPTEAEMRCFEWLVSFHQTDQCPDGVAWGEMKRSLWSEDSGWSRYSFLMEQLFSVIQAHRDALYFRDCYEELEGSTPEMGDTDGWNARGDALKEEVSNFGLTEEEALTHIRYFASPQSETYGGYLDMHPNTRRPYISRSGTITLDGEFDARTLRAILWFMTHEKSDG